MLKYLCRVKYIKDVNVKNIKEPEKSQLLRKTLERVDATKLLQF